MPLPLEKILNDAPVGSIDEAITVMTAVDETLPDDDGVKWFNRLYLRVTVGVEGAVKGAMFLDPAFLSELDVVFANQYFSALASGLTNSENAPAAWRPLLRARRNKGIARFQFALAGMNAHINRDLPAGIVQSFHSLGGDPIGDQTRKRDFDSVNDLLERVESEVKRDFAVGAIEVVDKLDGPIDDAVAMWNVRAARSAAWTNACVLWGLGALPLVRDEFFGRLDALVGMGSRALLLPIDRATVA
jgi:hypothetical protein